MYPEQILSAIETYWRSMGVATRMRDLLGLDVPARLTPQPPVLRRYSVTNELADLFSDIVRHWRVLDPKIREIIQNNLTLDDKDKPTRVSLL